MLTTQHSGPAPWNLPWDTWLERGPAHQVLMGLQDTHEGPHSVPSHFVPKDRGNLPLVNPSTDTVREAP